jgi:hypothetical protein
MVLVLVVAVDMSIWFVGILLLLYPAINKIAIYFTLDFVFVKVGHDVYKDDAMAAL